MTEIESAFTKKMGRPPKLDEQRLTALCAALSTGCTIASACAQAGISSASYRMWMSLARKGDPRFLAFLAAVKKAMANAESSLLSTIQSASIQHWQAAAWILERRFPKQWARRSSFDMHQKLTAKMTSKEVFTEGKVFFADGRAMTELSAEELNAVLSSLTGAVEILEQKNGTVKK